MGGGWRLPDTADWNKLVNYAGGTSTAGNKLKTKSGWDSSNGTDDFGFSALPGGHRTSYGSFYDVGYDGFWWSASEYDVDRAESKEMSYNANGAYNIIWVKSYGLSVRCVKDD
jgi:uncharacterized protein (TIGR02145 family)